MQGQVVKAGGGAAGAAAEGGSAAVGVGHEGVAVEVGAHDGAAVFYRAQAGELGELVGVCAALGLGVVGEPCQCLRTGLGTLGDFGGE